MCMRTKKLMKQVSACAGPAGPRHRRDRGGHTATQTPAGAYVLGAGWSITCRAVGPLSSIPWGAQLRLRSDGETEWSVDGHQLARGHRARRHSHASGNRLSRAQPRPLAQRRRKAPSGRAISRRSHQRRSHLSSERLRPVGLEPQPARRTMDALLSAHHPPR